MIFSVDDTSGDLSLMMICEPDDDAKIVRNDKRKDGYILLTRLDFVLAILDTMQFWPGCISSSGYSRVADLMDQVKIVSVADAEHFASTPEVAIPFVIDKSFRFMALPDCVTVTFKYHVFFFGALRELVQNPHLEVSFLPEEMRRSFVRNWCAVSDFMAQNAEV